MDWTNVEAELAKDLDRKHVKPPAPGKYGEYIEGWVAIKEANRIFGHGGWSYHVDGATLTNKELMEKTDRQGKPYQQWEVGYLATVTVAVDGVSRQDVGHGQGHSRSIGDAHDSAVKEAVTDALKRALRTFGYPFGLALYDKSKAHVSDDPGKLEREINEALKHIPTIETLDALKAYWSNLNATSAAVEDTRVINAKNERKRQLQTQAADPQRELNTP